MPTVSAKKARKSYKEPEEDKFDEAVDDAEDDVKDESAADDNQENGVDEDEDEEDEDMDEDEYVVEKIFSHYIAEDVRLLAFPGLARSGGERSLKIHG